MDQQDKFSELMKKRMGPSGDLYLQPKMAQVLIEWIENSEKNFEISKAMVSDLQNAINNISFKRGE